MAVVRSAMVTAAILAAACSDSDSPEPTAADEVDTPVESGERWARERPDRYRLTTRIECFCSQLPAWLDIVEDGRSVDHVELLTGGRDSFGPTGPRTMESLYDYVDELDAELPDGALITVDADPETGAIRRVEVDPIPNGDDDEWTLVVQMAPLAPDQTGTPPVLPADVDVSALDEARECSNGFGVMSADRTEAVLVAFFDTPPVDKAYRDVALPHHQWEVRVIVGETPSGAGCESSTSSERVAEAHAVGGRLTVVEPGEGVCDPVEVRIDDLTIEDGRGGRAQLGSVTVRGVFEWACDLYG